MSPNWGDDVKLDGQITIGTIPLQSAYERAYGSGIVQDQPLPSAPLPPPFAPPIDPTAPPAYGLRMYRLYI